MPEIYLTNELIQRRINLQRFSNSMIKDFEPYLKQMLNQLDKLIKSNSFEGASLATAEAKRAEIMASINKFSDKLAPDLLQQQLDFADNEANWMKSLYDNATVPSVSFATPAAVAIEGSIKANVLSFAPNGGISIAEAVNQFADGRGNAFMDIIRTGIQQGATNAQIQTAATAELQATSRHLKTLVRTATAATSGSIRDLFYSQNEQYLSDQYRWISVLDGRTTQGCAVMDGARGTVTSGNFVADNGLQANLPPRHFNCRSVIVRLPAEKYRLNLNAGRSSLNGYVDGNTTYQSWLRDQPNEFILGVLGDAKGQAFIDGKLTLKQMVDDSLRPLSLEELKKIYPRKLSDY